MKAHPLLVKKVLLRLKFFESRSNFKVKVTRSKILVTMESSCHKECTYEIWKPYLFWLGSYGQVWKGLVTRNVSVNKFHREYLQPYFIGLGVCFAHASYLTVYRKGILIVKYTREARALSLRYADVAFLWCPARHIRIVFDRNMQHLGGLRKRVLIYFRSGFNSHRILL